MLSEILTLLTKKRINLEMFDIIAWTIISINIQDVYTTLSLIFAFVLLPFMARLYQSGEFELIEQPFKTIDEFFTRLGQICRKPQYLICTGLNDLFFAWTMYYLYNIMLTNWNNYEYIDLKLIFLVGISLMIYYFIAPWILQRNRLNLSIKEITKNE